MFGHFIKICLIINWEGDMGPEVPILVKTAFFRPFPGLARKRDPRNNAHGKKLRVFCGVGFRLRLTVRAAIGHDGNVYYIFIIIGTS